MIIDLYVGYKEACCYGVEKVENSTIIVIESEVWYFIRNQQIGIDRGNEMFEELGISFGTALIVLLALYFIIKWAVKNGIKEAYRNITGKVTTEDIEAEQICNEEEK